MLTGNPLFNLSKGKRFFVCTNPENEENYLSLFIFVPEQSGETEFQLLELQPYEEKFSLETFDKTELVEIKGEKLTEYCEKYEEMVIDTKDKYDYDDFEKYVLSLGVE